MSIRKDTKNGKWIAQIGSGSNGTRKKKSFKLKREAEYWVELSKQKMKSGDNPFIDIEVLLEGYLSSLSGNGEGHQRDCRIVLEDFIKFNRINTLDHIGVSEVLKYRDKLTNSHRTINKKVGYIKSMLNYAIKRGYVQTSPLGLLDKLKESKYEQRALSENEISEFLRVAKETAPIHYPIFVFLAYTGCRRNEGVSLEWENIDLVRKMVSIKDKPHIKIAGIPFRCKWGSSRVIPLRRELIALLKTFDQASSWVFMNDLGNNLYNNFYRAFKRTLARTSIIRPEEVHPHTLRHSWVSHMLKSGVPIQDVSKMAGHRNLATTAKYAHFIGDDKTLHFNIDRLPEFTDGPQMDPEDDEAE